MEYFRSNEDAVPALTSGLFEEPMFNPEFDGPLNHLVGDLDTLGMAGDGNKWICEDVVQDAGGFLRHALSFFQFALIGFIALQYGLRIQTGALRLQANPA